MNYKYQIKKTKEFVKDTEKMKKRNLNMEKLKDIIITLSKGEELPAKNKDHSLKGDWTGYRECHIEPDWLLIYKIDNGNLILSLMRTGTHSDLF